MRHRERHQPRRRPGRIIPAILAGLVLLLGACGVGADDAPPADDEADDEVDDAAPDEEDQILDDAQAPATLREFTNMAIVTAASEWGVSEDEIEVIRSEEVDWPDGARGCPEEGEMYTQAIVPGYLVVLDVAGEQKHYHGGEGEAPFHCEDPQEPADT